MPRASLKQRALNLKAILQNLDGASPTLVAECVTNGEPNNIICWIMRAQCTLLLLLAGKQTEIGDYGWPAPEQADAPVQVFEGNLPSIKMPKETIMRKMPKAGPNMHDTQ